MAKTIPAPVQMAQDVLANLNDHPDFDLLKKKLPAFAMQYAAKHDLTPQILTEIAAQGIDALNLPNNKQKAEKTYQDVVQNLPKKEEPQPGEQPQRPNIRNLIQERFYPSLAPHVMHFIDNWDKQDQAGMRKAITEIETSIIPVNQEIAALEGSYDFHQLNVNDLLRGIEQDGVSVFEQLRQYASDGALEHLKLFHKIIPDLQAPHQIIPAAAYNTQLDVLDYCFKELDYNYPMIEDDYYREDYIVEKILKERNLETFKYLIENELSGDSYIHAKEAINDPDFFEYGFQYMHETDKPSSNFLRNVVTRGSLEQVKRIIEAGRYLANGDALHRDRGRDSRFHRDNPLPHALYEAQNPEMFTYLREHTTEDLSEQEITHTFDMLMLKGNYNLVDFLYETYPDHFTSDFLAEKFSSASRDYFTHQRNQNDKQLNFEDSAPAYLLQKFGDMIAEDKLAEEIARYFNYATPEDGVLNSALSQFPYDPALVWQRIIEDIDLSPSLSDIKKLEAYAITGLATETYITARNNMNAYDIGKADIQTITLLMDGDKNIPAASAQEWQDKIKGLSSYHKPIFDDVLAHLSTHPLKNEIFTTQFAKEIVVQGIGDNEYGAFELVDQIIRLCPTINENDFTSFAQNETEIEQTEKFLNQHNARNQWEKQHPDAPYSLLGFSPYLYQPKLVAELADIFEKEEELGRSTAEKYAYQTAGLFGSMPRVLTYLEKWGTETKQPLHDVVHSLKLPTKGRFDKAAWADAVIKHGPKMAELVHFAHRMPQPEKSADGKTWSYQKTHERAAEFVYENSDKAPELAKLCHGLKMGEQSFEAARKIVDKFNSLSQKKGKKPNQNIPEIEIDGSDFGKDGYQFKRLETGDLRGLFLGAMTGCCQWIGGIGSDCAEHGFKSPNGGFYAITNPSGDIVSQAWAWRGRQGEIVLDSIETLGAHVTQTEWKSICETMANHFAEKCKDVTALHIGTGGQTPDLGYAKTKSAKAIDKLGYSDAESQVAVWKREKYAR